MTFKEFLKLNTVDENIVKIPHDIPFEPVAFEADKNATFPASFDWRSKISLSPVRDQLHCGSCYAFSALATIEAQMMIKFGRNYELSVQEIVDCAGEFNTFGCEGGVKFRVFDYVAKTGVALEKDYEYEASPGACRAEKFKKIQIPLKGYGEVESFDEEELKKALVTVGPISVSLDINHETFMRYSQGIFFEPNCTSDTNHAAVLVGYGSENSEDFWIIKNSFGVTWGESGYMRLARNRNDHCGVTSESFYPVF